MSKEMIISVNGREKKIAILDNGKVTEFYIERGEGDSGIAGNIYKGRVQRVLPGMQSAFVSIGLERDAFLYVSDFFDEEEEIERIVMEKSKKGSAEDAKREANERIERSRVEREKQMDSAQEIAEPLAEIPATEEPAETGRKGRSRRGKKGRGEAAPPEATAEIKAEEQPQERPEPIFEFDDSGFERVIDDEETGDMFKDAYLQEAIFDKVRAIEFDMESTEEAEVGSVMSEFSKFENGFERIGDEEEETEVKPKPTRTSRTKGSKAKKSKADDAAVDVTESKPGSAKGGPKKKSAAKSPSSKSNKSKPAKKKAKKADEADLLPDSEISLRDTPDVAEMAVRRGGRGRRRGGRGRKTEDADASSGLVGFEDIVSDDGEEFSAAPEQTPIQDRENDPKPADEDPSGRSRNGGRDRADARGRDHGRRERKDRDEQRGDRGDRRPPQPTISDLLREGQEILVQIAKEPIARKGARITSHIALPGRFLVYMPTIEHLGVSRKIESSSERGRLRSLIQRIRSEEDIPSGGFIVRTAGIGISEEDLRHDARYLVRTWLDIKKKSEKLKSPAMVHQDLDIVQRLLRDQLSDDFTAIRVDSEEEYLRTVEFINRIQPRLVNRVKLYTREAPILEAYGVQDEVDKALKPRVWLKSGGYLVINQTEALVAIDVNTGKFVGKGNARLEDTITRTNMEAVEEIARQIRLRDLGGIIVLDLIDMEDRRNRHKVSQALQEALSTDKSPTKVLSFNDFGLIIMTRKRVKQSLERTLCSPCEYCEGAGWVKSPQTVCFEILSEARRLSKELEDVRQTTLRIHPDVAKALRSTEREVFDEIEAYLGNVDLTADPNVHQAQFDFAFI